MASLNPYEDPILSRYIGLWRRATEDEGDSISGSDEEMDDGSEVSYYSTATDCTQDVYAPLSFVDEDEDEDSEGDSEEEDDDEEDDEEDGEEDEDEDDEEEEEIPTARICTVCHKEKKKTSERLLACGQCRLALYCSPRCEKRGWDTHQYVCGQVEYGDTPEEEVYGYIITAYRLRVEDDFSAGDILPGCLYDEFSPKPLRHFREYLDKAEERGRVLPPWWSWQKRIACEAIANNQSGGHCIHRRITRRFLTRFYNESSIRQKLRTFVGKVYGFPSNGDSFDESPDHGYWPM